MQRIVEYSVKGARWSAFLALLALALGLVGCGGGGGGGGSAAPANVSGRVLLATTNLPPNPSAVVTFGSQSQTVDANGNFSLSNVPSNLTTATVAAQGSQTRTLTIALTANQNNDLGDIFLSDTGYTAVAKGRVLTQDTNQPVGNATVTIAGSQAKTGTDGKFTISNLPIGLGNIAGAAIGKVTATGFEDKPIVPQFALVTGDNNLGDLLIAQPVGSATPSPPFTITGKVIVKGAATANQLVTLFSGATMLGTSITDLNGSYFFWVVPGTYTVTATHESANGQVSVTLTKLDTPVTAPPINF